MSTEPNARLLCDVWKDRICWAIKPTPAVNGRGVVHSFDELAGIAARAGIFTVIIDDVFRTLEVRVAATRYKWTLVNSVAMDLAARGALLDEIEAACGPLLPATEPSFVPLSK